MKKLILLALLLCPEVYAATRACITTPGTYNASSGATWIGGVAPNILGGDSITCATATVKVIIDQDYIIGNSPTSGTKVINFTGGSTLGIALNTTLTAQGDAFVPNLQIAAGSHLFVTSVNAVSPLATPYTVTIQTLTNDPTNPPTWTVGGSFNPTTFFGGNFFLINSDPTGTNLRLANATAGAGISGFKNIVVQYCGDPGGAAPCFPYTPGGTGTLTVGGAGTPVLFDHTAGVKWVSSYTSADCWNFKDVTWQNTYGTLAPWTAETGFNIPSCSRSFDTFVFDQTPSIEDANATYNNGLFMKGYNNPSIFVSTVYGIISNSVINLSWQNGTLTWSPNSGLTITNFILTDDVVLGDPTTTLVGGVPTAPTPLATGTVTSSISGTLTSTATDTSKSFTTNQFASNGTTTWTFVVTGGTGRGQTRIVSSNSSQIITTLENWETPLDNTSTYAIYSGPTNVHWTNGNSLPIGFSEPAYAGNVFQLVTDADNEGDVFHAINAAQGSTCNLWKGPWSSSHTELILGSITAAYSQWSGVSEAGIYYSSSVQVNSSVDPSTDGGVHWTVVSPVTNMFSGCGLHTMTGNIIAASMGANDSTGTFLTGGNAAYFMEKNTYFDGNQSAAFDESRPAAYPGQFKSVQYNLAWSKVGRTYVGGGGQGIVASSLGPYVLQNTDGSSTANYIDAGALTCGVGGTSSCIDWNGESGLLNNGFCASPSGDNQGGSAAYQIICTKPVGTNDVVVSSPGFVDPFPDPGKWLKTFGIGSSLYDPMAIMPLVYACIGTMNNLTGVNTNCTPSKLYNYYFNAASITNAALTNVGPTTATLGAGAYIAPPTIITLNGSTYTMKSPPIVWFDGAGGIMDTGIKYNGGLAPKALSSNPPWVGLTTSTTFLSTNYPYNSIDNIDLYENGEIAHAYAANCYSDNTQTAYCNAALDMLNNIQKYYPYFCDENQHDCIADGDAGQYVGSYGIIYWAKEWTAAFQLMQSQMTGAQIQTFTDKILNDLSTAGGISGAPSTSCTNPTTNTGVSVTVSGGVITAASALFGSGNPIQVDYWIARDSIVGLEIAKIASITDSTHAVLPSRLASAWNGYSGTISFRRDTWVTGDCGMLWLNKHGRFVPQALSWVSGASVYPSSGPVFSAGYSGGDFQSYNSNNTFGTYEGLLAELLSTVATDVNSSSRSQPQITALYNDWFTNVYQSFVVKDWTGYHLEGNSYGIDRPPAMAFMNTILQNSLTSPPAIGGLWDKNLLYHSIMNLLPGCQTAEPAWGADFGMNNGSMNADHLGNFTPIYFVYRNTNEGKWFNWMMRNRMSVCTNYGNTPGTNLTWTGPNLSGGGSGIPRAQWSYEETDPSFPLINIATSGPTAVVLNQVTGTVGEPQSVLISRTGYSSILDTLVNFYGMGERTIDHNLPAAGYYPGDVRIYKGNTLLGDDGAVNGQPYSTVFNNYNNGTDHSGYMEIGGATNLVSLGVPLHSQMSRGNADSTLNRFAYALVDSTASYASGTTATRVHRHLVDFKESQQFVIVYDDVVTTSGKQKQTYLHYPNNFGASSDSTRGTTTVSGQQITSTNPGTGNGDATQLLTQVLAPAGTNTVDVYTNNTNGTYTGGNGATFRVSVCASTTGSTCDTTNTEGEFIVVHEPVAGSGNTLPSMAVIATIDSNHRGVEVDGSSPKVAVFPRGGTTYTSATFTTAHSGTAQYIIIGVTPGTYNVTVGGVAVVSGVVVSANDNTLYFESTAGAMAMNPIPPSTTNLQGVTQILGTNH